MDIQKMLRQSKEMHEQLVSLREDLAHVEIIGNAPGVELVFNGNGLATGARIDASLAGEELDSAIVVAINHAKVQLDEAARALQEKLYNGMPVPPNMPLE